LSRSPAPTLARGCVCALALVCFFAIVATTWADDTRDGVYAERARVAFEQAQAQYRSQMDNPVIAWNFARTCYDWADWATNKVQRATIAREGIAACHQSLLFTNSTSAHYYLAMNMGQLAQSEGLGALKLVRQMQSEFLIAADLDPATDFGGPERGLGLLCRDAPGWPLSIGNRSRARQFLEQAVTLAPNYPENVLNLAESEFMWGQKAEAGKEFAALESLWPSAQKVLTGEKWEQSWDDWSKRRDVLRTKLDQ
jgi:tetratricopeptide (TPR) repeat protein